MQQQLCNKANGGAKVSYRTRAAAEKSRRHLGVKLFVYGPCRFCDGWHLTHEPRRFKTIEPPSLKTLKRWLENQTKVIAACQRRFDAAEAKLAVETARVTEQRLKSERIYREELSAIRKMTERLQRV